MADEKKIADEKKLVEENLSDEGEASTDELDKVAGGARYYPTSISCITPNTDTDSNPLGAVKIWPSIR